MAGHWMITKNSFRWANPRALSIVRPQPVTDQAAEAALCLIGVDYLRVRFDSGGELYLTRFGLPFREHLAPENWYAPDWFARRRIRLKGTSAIYKVPSKPVRGVSLDLVVRFSRVGQEVLLDPRTLGENFETEFNSPFEEFALVMELRAASLHGARTRIFTKHPLAIYVPPEEFQDWQLGRHESKLAAKEARHPEIKLVRLQQYILLYGWIDGLNAVETTQAVGIAGGSRDRFLAETTMRAIHELDQCGFRVVDMKPEHIVLRIRSDDSLLRLHSGNLAYALVDYELLQRAREPN